MSLPEQRIIDIALRCGLSINEARILLGRGGKRPKTPKPTRHGIGKKGRRAA